MRVGGYELRLLTGNVKHGLAVAAAMALWVLVTYVTGLAVARFTPYTIAESWPRPLGLALAGAAVVLGAWMVLFGLSLVIGYFVEIEEVADDA